MSNASITVVIPTFRRPGALKRAAESVFAQSREGLGPVELVIVDNDPAGSARETIAALSALAPFPVTGVHETRPGVACARNTGVAGASGEFIAFLDDDETADPHWLAELMRVQGETGADAVFGPVRAETGEAGDHAAYFRAFFSRDPRLPEGPTPLSFGCGGALVRRSRCLTTAFDPRQNEIGGEDDVFFQTIAGEGARFAWAPGAVVHERPEPRRVTLNYTLARAFAYGQGPSAAAARMGPKGWPRVAFWMGAGAGQAAVYGAVAGVKWLLRARDRAVWLDRAVRGLGKLCWFGPFKIGFYGASAPSGVFA